MDFKKELSAFGYNLGNSIDVEILISEILPKIIEGKKTESKNIILWNLWEYCEKEFKADFENDYINGYGSKTGMSERVEKFANKLSNKLCKDKS